MLRRISYKLTLVILATASLLLCSAPATSAIDGSWWNAGHIIDDQVFYNNNSMSVDQIQNFLNAKVPHCDNMGAEQYSGGQTVYQYFHPRGIKFPVTCLRDYYENTSNLENNFTQTDGQAAPIPAGAISAAQIIWNASQQYTINPQVLITLIQKESLGGLITDDSPLPAQYTTPTGYACPDSASCNADYYGFYNQINKAAHQFRAYGDAPNDYNYVIGNNQILLKPNSSCGSTNVYIANQATASLYDYTPYQPDQAALDNLYGSGDSCSSYGNRNFWRYFNDWFGGTLVSYNWASQGYRVLTADESQYLDPGQLQPGHMYLGKLTAFNQGSAIWTNNGPTPFTLAPSKPAGHNSFLCNNTWLSCNRVVYLQESSVTPGNLGHFKFLFQAPYQPGDYREYFRPVAEFLGWGSDTDDSLGIVVKSPGTYSWSSEGYRVLTADESAYVDPGQLQPGQTYLVKLHARNTGTATWTNNGPTPVTLATGNPTGHASFLCNNTWLTCNRQAYLQESSVAPGSLGHFKFLIQAPNTPGAYREYFQPVAEFLTWFNSSDDSLGIVVK